MSCTILEDLCSWWGKKKKGKQNKKKELARWANQRRKQKYLEDLRKKNEIFFIILPSKDIPRLKLD